MRDQTEFKTGKRLSPTLAALSLGGEAFLAVSLWAILTGPDGPICFRVMIEYLR